MGRGTRRRGGNGAGANKRPREAEWKADARDPETLTNAAFEAFYRGTIIPEEEWGVFMASMRAALPTSMRINATLPADVIAGLRSAVREALEATAEAAEQVRTLDFVPDGLALQAPVSRGALKRDVSHKASKLLITALNDLGMLTRQEAVSMIPPLLLDVRPGERVLDMCAAPGSKTGQLLEAVMGPDGAHNANGCVVANEINASRLDVLAFQTARLPRAHAHLLISQHDAMAFPLASSPEGKFDRVLCDVMCSGDGTLRKSRDLWTRWTTMQGPELHHSQCRTLLRGMSLCRKGGVVVYSTCSLNPIEDEAVVSACITASRGTFRVAETAHLLPELKRTPGRTTWRFLSKNLEEEFASFDEAQVRAAPGKGPAIKPTMFPSSEIAQQGIENTWRVLPHQQDTGGFFIAKLECLDDFPNSFAAAKAPRDHELRPVSAALGASVVEALGLPPDFPVAQLFIRSESAREQKFYYLAEGTIAALRTNHARIGHVGAKIFESAVKYSNTALRFSSEGLSTLVHLLPPSFVVDVSPQLLLDAARVDGVYPLQKLLEAAGRERAQLPPRCFVARAVLPRGLGTILISGELGVVARLRISEREVALAKFSLGLPLVVEHVPDADTAADCASAQEVDVAVSSEPEQEDKEELGEAASVAEE